MAEIIINDVKYTNVPNKKAGTKFASALTQSNIGMSQAVQDYVNSSYFYALINAIDINWDGIDIGENTYINTTSDLIKWIESKAGDIDLSSYATVAYVNQKFEDLIGGAPETLDTLKELADALQEDASLAYVTQALEGKANVNDVYTKQEVDNLIPAPVDLSNYVSYTQANSYYVAKEDMPDMNDYAIKAETFSTKNYTNGELITSYWNPNNIVQKYYNVGYRKSRQLVFPLYAEKNWLSGGCSGSDSIFALTTNQSKYLSLVQSFVFGDNNEAHHNSGNTYPLYSNILIGDNLKSNTHYTTVFGIYNNVGTYDESASSSFNPDDSNHSLFVIGNGKNDSDRHNAFEIKRNGQIWIADTYNGTPYSLQSRLNSKANANDVYTKTEVDNMIPESADLSNYVSYTDANSYYMTVEGPKQVINSPKTFVGNKLINFRQSISSDKLGFTLYNNNEKELGGLEWRPNTIGTRALLSLQQYLGTGGNFTGVGMSYLGFRLTEKTNGKYNLITPLPSHVNTIETINVGNDYRNFFFPLVFKNGSNKVYTDCTGLVDMTSLMPNLNDYTTTSYVTTELDKKANTNDVYTKTEVDKLIPAPVDLSGYVSYTQANSYYVDINSYNALVARVEELASWIVSYHTPVIQDVSLWHTIDGDTISVSYISNNGSEIRYLDISDSTTHTINFDSNVNDIVMSVNGISTGITVNNTTWPYSIQYTPSMMTEGGNYSFSFSRNMDSSYNAFYSSFAFNVESSTPEPSKQSPSASWSNTSGGTEVTVVAGDTTTVSCTFNGTPASGWTLKSDQMITGISIDSSTMNVTIDPTNMMSGTYYVDIEYYEDSSYYYGYGQLLIRVLPSGTNPNFYYSPDSMTIYNDGMSPSGNLVNNYDPSQVNLIIYTSNAPSTATVDSDGNITWVSGGSATITAEARHFDGQGQPTLVTTATLYVTCEVQKSYPSGSWTNAETGTLVTVVAGDSNTVTCTFNGTPASGWTLKSDPMITGISIDSSTMNVTIDPTNMMSGTYNVDVEYYEDSSYYYGSNSLQIKVLPSGTNPNFYFMDDVHVSDGMPSMVNLHNNITYDHMGYSSNDTSIATVDSNGYVTWVSGGNTTITATAYDINNTVLATATCNVFCNKLSASGVWSNISSLGKCIVVAGDTNTVTCTFSGTPESGWSINDPVITGITIDSSTMSVTIDPTNMMTGNYHVYAEYPEDSSYNYGNMELWIRVLPSGSDVNFFFENDSYSLDDSMNQSMDIYIETTINNTISWSSSDTGVCSIAQSPMSWNGATITYVSDGSATLTATIDDNGTTRTATCTVTCSSMTP